MRKYLIISLVMVAILLAAVGTFHALTPTRRAVADKAGEVKPGEIRGRVVDASGQPVPKAKLHLREAGTNPNGRIIFYWSDAQGNFSIKALPPGTYDVFVSKEEEGYPDTDIFFYSSDQRSVPQVVISEQQPTPSLTVRMGPRVGTLTGRVINAVTGAPIGNATLTFSRPENQYMTLMTSLNQPEVKGGFNFLLPSAPLTIKATAPGYADWSYKKEGSNNQMDLFTIEPGQTTEMVIRMRPLR